MRVISLIVALILTGCQVKESPASPVTVNQELVQKYRWQLIAFNPERQVPEKTESVPFIEFLASGKVSGFTGCNRFQSSANLKDGAVAFGPVMSSKRYCVATASTESAFIEALPKVSYVSFENEQLNLLDSNKTVLMTFKGVRR